MVPFRLAAVTSPLAVILLEAFTSVKLPAAAALTPMITPSISPPSISTEARVPKLVIFGWAAV